jgi:chromosome partitioning protein
MDIVSVYNDKGGVGKTTITLQIASAMAISGKRVLVIDNDPQGSLSISCTSDLNVVREGIDKVYKGDKTLTDVIYDTYIENLFVVPAGITLKDYYMNRSTQIKERVDNLIDFMKTNTMFLDLFDIVIFDNPPTQDGVALYCTLSADKIIIPTIPDSICLDALVRTYAFIKVQAQKFEDKYVIIVPSLVKNRNLHKTHLKAIIDEYNGKNGNTIVSDVKVGDVAIIPESIGSKQILLISHAASESASQFKKLCLDVFPWLEENQFSKSLNDVAEAKKKQIRANFMKMVEERRKKVTIVEKELEVANV